MLLVTAIGLGMWIYALATAPAAAPPVPAGSVAGFSADGSLASSSNRTRLIDESAPATFRLGFSFVVGFFLAWMLRRFIKMVLLIGGGIATLLIVLKSTGVVNLNFDAVQSEVDQGLKLAQENASRFKGFILGYVPSGVSAAAGMLFGARRRA